MKSLNNISTMFTNLLQERDDDDDDDKHVTSL
jgi:hypothetical protein